MSHNELVQLMASIRIQYMGKLNVQWQMVQRSLILFILGHDPIRSEENEQKEYV